MLVMGKITLIKDFQDWKEYRIGNVTFEEISAE